MEHSRKEKKGKSKSKKLSHNPEQNTEFKSSKQASEIEAFKQNELISTLKKSTDYVLHVFKLLHETPLVMKNAIDDVEGHAKNLEKLLKQFVSRVSTLLNEHEKMKESCHQIEMKNAKLVRENIDYKCDVDVLQKQLEELKQREQQRIGKKKNTTVIQSIINQEKNQLEEKIRKKIKEKNHLNSRKQSLPVISASNARVNRLKFKNSFIVDNVVVNEMTDRLIRHLSHKGI